MALLSCPLAQQLSRRVQGFQATELLC